MLLVNKWLHNLNSSLRISSLYNLFSSLLLPNVAAEIHTKIDAIKEVNKGLSDDKSLLNEQIFVYEKKLKGEPLFSLFSLLVSLFWYLSYLSSLLSLLSSLSCLFSLVSSLLSLLSSLFSLVSSLYMTSLFMTSTR